jgi:hypothetical protein
MKRTKKPPVADARANKVFLALQYLDAGEVKRLIKYLHSPYFNQSKTLTRLCETFLGYLEHGQKTFDRHAAWKKLFSNVPYDDVNFRKHCSDLLRIVEGFMAQEIIARDKGRQEIDLLEFVVQRKVEPLYNSALREARTGIEAKSYRSIDYYKKNHAIEQQYFSMMDFDVKLDTRTNIEAISHNLDIYYWIEKLKLRCVALSQRKTGTEQYQINFMDEIVAYLQRYPIEDAPELAIYYYMYLTLSEEENAEHYYNLRRLLDQYGGVMPRQEAIDLFDSALHYCTGKLNKGDRIFLQEYFDLFQAAIGKGVFLVKGEFAPWRFNNVVGVALRLGKYDWAGFFIETYRSYLPAETRQNTYTFNLARLYRYKKQYDKVLKLLSNIEYEDIGYNLISKAMLVITYYELDELDALESFMESFRVFLNRHKTIPQERRISYMNLLKYVKRLTRLIPGDKNALAKLHESIEREKTKTVNYEWLLEKLRELE